MAIVGVARVRAVILSFTRRHTVYARATPFRFYSHSFIIISLIFLSSLASSQIGGRTLLSGCFDDGCVDDGFDRLVTPGSILRLLLSGFSRRDELGASPRLRLLVE